MVFFNTIEQCAICMSVSCDETCRGCELHSTLHAIKRMGTDTPDNRNKVDNMLVVNADELTYSSWCQGHLAMPLQCL